MISKLSLLVFDMQELCIYTWCTISKSLFICVALSVCLATYLSTSAHLHVPLLLQASILSDLDDTTAFLQFHIPPFLSLSHIETRRILKQKLNYVKPQLKTLNGSQLNLNKLQGENLQGLMGQAQPGSSSPLPFFSLFTMCQLHWPVFSCKNSTRSFLLWEIFCICPAPARPTLPLSAGCLHLILEFQQKRCLNVTSVRKPA